MAEEVRTVAPARDHLFISYATEDAVLCEWLVLRLTAEGYKVWCDRIKLLGGESYPRDIDQAMKERTFRVIAILSRASLAKPNPTKERTLALNIATERKIDFLIPLNAGGLSATELDWMTSDLTFIPFASNWAAGFAALLNKLASVNAPRELANGRTSVCQWFAAQSEPTVKTERLWSNALPIVEFPRALDRYEFAEVPPLDSATAQWLCYHQSEKVYWAFDAPGPGVTSRPERSHSYSWQDVRAHDGIVLGDVAIWLLRHAVDIYCHSRGLQRTPDRKRLYFPPSSDGESWLPFTSYTGNKSRIKASGQRTFSLPNNLRERCRYYLSPSFYVDHSSLTRPILRVNLAVVWTDMNGNFLEPAKAQRRRKALCKHWWNHQWLTRVLAVTQWLTRGQDACTVLKTPSGNLVFKGEPCQYSIPVGIIEAPPPAEEENEDEAVIHEQEVVSKTPDGEVEAEGHEDQEDFCEGDSSANA